MDMRDKVEGQDGGVTLVNVSVAGTESGPRQEAFTALTSLGYKPAEARRMVDNADDELATTEDILRSVLQSAAPSGVPR